MIQKISRGKKISLFIPLIIITLISLSGFVACKNSNNKSNGSSGNQGTKFEYTHDLSFTNAHDSVEAKIKVVVADTPEKRDAGLMNVTHLREDNGMLFVFEKTQPLSFWMANTPLPLDIIFIDKDHKIVRIYHSTTPYSKNELNSGSPARYVVEVNGGFCIDHDITEGMMVKF